MRIRLQNELLLLNILAVLLIIIITFFPSNVLRIILGLPLVLFFPGHTLTSALFPRRGALDSIERVALSFVLSIAVVALIGMVLNYTPWGIRLYPMLIAISIFILTTSLIAWHRRRRLAEMERFTISLTFTVAVWRGQSFPDKILSVILIVVVLGTIGTLGYVVATPKIGEKFTEFYILGPEGKAEGYPKELLVGQEVKVIVGVVNREYETVSYRVEVTIDGIRHNEIDPVVLGHEDRWKREVSFTPARLGNNQKVEFLLYKQEQSEAYRSLHLWVNVIE